MTNPALQKTHLRKSIGQCLQSLTKEQKEHASLSLCHKIAAYITESCPRNAIIASFAGLATEPQLFELHRLLPAYRFCYPLCGESYSMSFYQVDQPAQDLKKGLYGIMEPSPQPERLIATTKISAIIVPAVAYTNDGTRLGKGKGYYDRFLKQLHPDAHIIGAAFSLQQLGSIPSQSHDIKVNLVFFA